MLKELLRKWYPVGNLILREYRRLAMVNAIDEL